jgi:hypothetical protein
MLLPESNAMDRSTLKPLLLLGVLAALGVGCSSSTDSSDAGTGGGAASGGGGAASTGGGSAGTGGGSAGTGGGSASTGGGSAGTGGGSASTGGGSASTGGGTATGGGGDGTFDGGCTVDPDCAPLSADGGFRCCTGACVDVRASVDHCGSCGGSCSAAHSTPACSAAMCVILGCDPGYADCDLDPNDGCESTPPSDPNNCGTCGVQCTYGPHSTALCTQSNCSIACDPGYRDCDQRSDDGCEVHSDADTQNCGLCGRQCMAPTATCFNGQCQ